MRVNEGRDFLDIADLRGMQIVDGPPPDLLANAWLAGRRVTTGDDPGVIVGREVLRNVHGVIISEEAIAASRFLPRKVTPPTPLTVILEEDHASE